jgi:hypothetical protein
LIGESSALQTTIGTLGFSQDLGKSLFVVSGQVSRSVVGQENAPGFGIGAIQPDNGKGAKAFAPCSFKSPVAGKNFIRRASNQNGTEEPVCADAGRNGRQIATVWVVGMSAKTINSNDLVILFENLSH